MLYCVCVCVCSCSNKRRRKLSKQQLQKIASAAGPLRSCSPWLPWVAAAEGAGYEVCKLVSPAKTLRT